MHDDVVDIRWGRARFFHRRLHGDEKPVEQIPIGRQRLVDPGAPVIVPQNDVGKGAADIDGEGIATHDLGPRF